MYINVLSIMFSSKDYLARKTSADGVDRLSYLQALVTEFQDTDDLGNFFNRKNICDKQIIINA